MSLFEQLKLMPKIDLHVNLTGSISPNLVLDLNNDLSIQDLEEEMVQRNDKDYLDSLEVPINVLKSKNNIKLAVLDIINRLKNNNVIYSELFLDLPLYNNKISEEKLLKTVIDVIRESNFNMQVVLCVSDKKNKEENIKTLDLLDKYYLNGVNGIYFDKGKMTNIPYILNLNTKLTNQDHEIYYHAKRIIYTLPEFDMEIINYLHENKVTFEFSITGLKESNVFSELENYDIYNLYKENNLITFVSRDMTILNTDILNEYCLIFNKLPFTVHDIIKINLNNLENCNIPIDGKNDIINMYRDKSNLIL